MNVWLQLGLGGASLFILYTFVNKLFEYLKNKNETDAKSGKSSSTQMGELMKKLDRMADSNFAMAKQMAENKAEQGKDIKAIFSKLGLCYTLLSDMNISITRIDDRTNNCISNKE